MGKPGAFSSFMKKVLSGDLFGKDANNKIDRKAEGDSISILSELSEKVKSSPDASIKIHDGISALTFASYPMESQPVSPDPIIRATEVMDSGTFDIISEDTTGCIATAEKSGSDDGRENMSFIGSDWGGVLYNDHSQSQADLTEVENVCHSIADHVSDPGMYLGPQLSSQFHSSMEPWEGGEDSLSYGSPGMHTGYVGLSSSSKVALQDKNSMINDRLSVDAGKRTGDDDNHSAQLSTRSAPVPTPDDCDLEIFKNLSLTCLNRSAGSSGILAETLTSVHPVELNSASNCGSEVLCMEPVNLSDSKEYIFDRVHQPAAIMDNAEIRPSLGSLVKVELSEIGSATEGYMARIHKWVSEIVPADGSQEETETEDEIRPGPMNADPHSECVPVPASVHRGVTGTDMVAMQARQLLLSVDRRAHTLNLSARALKTVPSFGSFHNLRSLFLSSNSIGSVPAGALPRSLHTLDLSRNCLVSVEGLRDLTKLRVLSLAHNKITRIGHGLASCSSLRELYLSDNKISEVEGLHRLLKLSVLDLGHNKLTSTKSLGQLAANYGSMLALNLAGNPIHVNLGADAFSKLMRGLLPNLEYLNDQRLKVTSTREGAVEVLRSGLGPTASSAQSLSTRTKTASRPSARVSTNSSSKKDAATSLHHRSAGTHNGKVTRTSERNRRKIRTTETVPNSAR